jgi:CcmD family protein
MRTILIVLVLLMPTLALAEVAPVPPANPNAAALRKTCADAMNADPSFADAIVATINEDTARQHRKAADDIAKNERHVILAYAAMWVVAAGFVLFLWRRQQHLKGEIAQLRKDLEAASK